MVLAFLVSMLPGRAQFDEEVFGRISTDEGLSSAVVTCILKDSRGFMWFGTQNGLNKFDGYTFTTYIHNDTLPHSLSGNYILSLFEDAGGNIWVGTEGNGLNCYNRFTDQFTIYKQDTKDPASISSNSVRTVVQTAAGLLYFGTGKGINVFDAESQSFRMLNLSGTDTLVNQLSVYELYIDTDSSLWIGTANGLLHYLPGQGRLKRYTHDPGNDQTISNNFINCVRRTATGSLLIGTNRGLNYFNAEEDIFTHYYYNQDDAFSEAKSEVQAIAEDLRGNIWVASFGGGLFKIDNMSGRSALFVHDPDLEESLSNDYVYSLNADDSGILWIGTYGGGINIIDLSKIRFDHLEADRNDPNSLPGNDVYSILPMSKEVWFGTDNGLGIWNRDTDEFFTSTSTTGRGSTTSNSIYCLLEDPAGNVWIGTAGNGLNRLSSESRNMGRYAYSPFILDSGQGSLQGAGEVLCLHLSPVNDIWVGTSGGIFIIRNDSVINHFTHDPAQEGSLADNEVYDIITDSEGQTWIGTISGLNLFNPADSTFTLFENLAETGSVYSIYCLHQDSMGFLWAGTDNSGLLKIDPVQKRLIRQYTRADQLPDNVIYGILEDGDQNLWMSSNSGIVKAMQQTGSDNLSFIQYNSSNWLVTDSYNYGAFARGADGTLYFGSFEGVTHFHPDNVKGNTKAPPVYITGFELFFEKVSISDDNSTPLSAHISETRSIRLKHNQNVLKFEFAALNYILPGENRYAFMMENLENTWNFVGNQREAQYMYIPPGDYVFRVKAANNDGVWNETGTSVNITIVPPFTRTAWFYIIIAAGLIILVIWIMNLRTRQLKASRNRLEKQVQLRTHELRATNKNLEEEIQERKKVQEALAKSEARFRQLIETMNEGFTVLDRLGKINYVNPKLCEMFGMEAEEAIGRSPEDFIDDSSPVYRERFIHYRDKSIRTGNVESYEMNWKRKDGTVFTAMVSPRQIVDENNRYSGSVAVLTDITDLKNAERELITKNKDLNTALNDLKKTQAQLIDSEKMASLGQLTAGVAHEINNPINFVSGNVKPLQRDIEDILSVLGHYDTIIEKLGMDADFSEVEAFKKEIDFEFVLSEINHLLEGIGEGATRTAEIVKGLRNFSRMDEHELKLADINQGIDSTLLILHNKIKGRIEIIKEYGDFPDIMCYPGQLNQVFLNLLNNAQEAIDGDGKIVIRTWKEGHQVKISIGDSGRGIPDRVKKKIFDPFYTTKEVGKGTGLGLSISFGIVEKHNGNIIVKSEPGKGAEFIVSIPDNLI
jgi:PAS domain S-box-containing protein